VVTVATIPLALQVVYWRCNTKLHRCNSKGSQPHVQQKIKKNEKMVQGFAKKKQYKNS